MCLVLSVSGVSGRLLVSGVSGRILDTLDTTAHDCVRFVSDGVQRCPTDCPETVQNGVRWCPIWCPKMCPDCPMVSEKVSEVSDHSSGTHMRTRETPLWCGVKVHIESETLFECPNILFSSGLGHY